jgi:hypothetical protein
MTAIPLAKSLRNRPLSPEPIRNVEHSKHRVCKTQSPSLNPSIDLAVKMVALPYAMLRYDVGLPGVEIPHGFGRSEDRAVSRAIESSFETSQICDMLNPLGSSRGHVNTSLVDATLPTDDTRRPSRLVHDPSPCINDNFTPCSFCDNALSTAVEISLPSPPITDTAFLSVDDTPLLAIWTPQQLHVGAALHAGSKHALRRAANAKSFPPVDKQSAPNRSAHHHDARYIRIDQSEDAPRSLDNTMGSYLAWDDILIPLTSDLAKDIGEP